MGLKRAGFSASEISTLKHAFRLLFRTPLAVDESLLRIEAECDGEHATKLVEFVRSSDRGICRRNDGS